MNSTDTRELAAAEHQMPTLWAKHNATVRQYLHHSGGGMMTLERVLDETTGAHICLTEDNAFYVWVYSDGGDKCEGHEIVVTGSDSNAVWWFLHGTTPEGPCPCMADNA